MPEKQEKYVYQPYPKWCYHKTQDPVIVKDPNEHAALGPGWADSPAGPWPEDEPEPLDAHGVEVSESTPVKRRGRPRGSKNKSKVTAAVGDTPQNLGA